MDDHVQFFAFFGHEGFLMFNKSVFLHMIGVLCIENSEI